MAVRKTAISIPEELLVQVDQAATDLGESRSRYITRILEASVKARRDAEVTRRLDVLFAAEPQRQSQGQASGDVDEDTSWREDGW